jgi:hypothetical protein
MAYVILKGLRIFLWGIPVKVSMKTDYPESERGSEPKCLKRKRQIVTPANTYKGQAVA